MSWSQPRPRYPNRYQKAIAFVTSLARCVDVVSDPLMANVTDATRSRFGRRRPYMFVGCFLYGGCFFLLASPPEGGGAATWFGIFYVLFFLTDTIVNIPHNALGQEVAVLREWLRRSGNVLAGRHSCTVRSYRRLYVPSSIQ